MIVDQCDCGHGFCAARLPFVGDQFPPDEIAERFGSIRVLMFGGPMVQLGEQLRLYGDPEPD